jgi:hypothetical protein
MYWFGKNWGLACDLMPQIETPVGLRCSYCPLPIAEEDSGVELPYVGPKLEKGHFTVHDGMVHVIYHRDCLLRNIGIPKRGRKTHDPL